MSQINIRPLQPTDKPAVLCILQNTPEFLPFEVVIAEELLDSYIEYPGECGYHIKVAEINHDIAGYVCYGHDSMTESSWDIFWIAVDRNRQGLGIGRALMQDTEACIQTLGGRLVVVETSSKPNYHKTRKFYLDLKYKEIARIPEFYAADDDGVIFIKRVDKEA